MRHQSPAFQSVCFKPTRVAAAALALLGLPLGSLQAIAADAHLSDVNIISTTPLPGTNSFVEEVAAPVESYRAKDIEDSQAIDLSDFLNRSAGGVHINEIQGNPLQADVNYRGFTASPLLGTPQGISVYLDGVRLNQPFGDVVSWDLIPRSALASVTLIPGSNPLFGLNTLGGALSLTTKDGRNFPGTVGRLSLGSHARRTLELEHGGSNDQGWDWYVLGNQFAEDGWRDDSRSRQNQLFSKIGYRNNGSELKLSMAAADNRLIGNGLQESTLLAQNYSSVYTKPDVTENQSILFNLQGKHQLSDSLVLTGNLYNRRIKTRTFNGDINDEALESTGVYAAGQSRNNAPFPSSNCMDAAAMTDPDMRLESAEVSCTAVNGRSNTRQRNTGASLQLTQFKDLGGNTNQLTVGAAIDQNRTHFRQTSEFGFLLPDRSTQGVGVFTEELDEDGAPVVLDGKTRTYSAYATNTYSMAGRWHLSTSGRYNRTRLQNFDRLQPLGPGVNPDETLNADYRYQRFNPAVGLTFSPTKTLNWYAGYNEGSRTPTSIELGCANPERACRLPNSMAGDPYLKQVVTRTVELGMRSRPTSDSEVNLEVFRANNRDDIQFVSSGTNPNLGFFRNFGETRRQGVEMEWAQRWGDIRTSLNYNYLEATYESEDTFVAASNSSARDANFTDSNGMPATARVVDVKKGQRIPLIPRHIIKLGVQWQTTAAWSNTLQVQAIGNSLARGNENGGHQADGEDFLAGGKSAGSAVVNMLTQYRFNRQMTVQAGIRNLFDRRYSSAAQLGPLGFENGAFAGNDGMNRETRHSTFFAPGAPRLFSVTLIYRFDETGAKK